LTTDLSKYLDVQPVDKRDGIGDNHDPDDNRERFAESFPERSPHFFSLIYLRKKENYHKNHQEKKPFTHQSPIISKIAKSRLRALLEMDQF